MKNLALATIFIGFPRASFFVAVDTADPLSELQTQIKVAEQDISSRTSTETKSKINKAEFPWSAVF